MDLLVEIGEMVGVLCGFFGGQNTPNGDKSVGAADGNVTGRKPGYACTYSGGRSCCKQGSVEFVCTTD